MKKQFYLLLIIFYTSSISLISAKPEEIAEKSRLTRNEIIKKDEEKRAKILKKFSDFQMKVKNFAPDMKINIPINPDKAEDILDLDNDSELKKQEKYFAWTAESYKLRTLPYDSIKEYTALVSKGDRVTVLMKPDLKKNKSYQSITKDWLLIRTTDGIEGYIPLNLLLNKKPGNLKKTSLTPDKNFNPSNNYGLKDKYRSPGEEKLFVLTQYTRKSKGVKKDDFVSHLNTGANLYVKSDILRVRDAPDDYGTVLFSLENKDRVQITEIEPGEVTLGGKKSKWVKIKYLSYDGWVFGAFLSKDRDAFEEGDSIEYLFQIPINDDYFISSKFGKRILNGIVSNHSGVDLPAPCGTNVVSAADGNVIMVVEDSRNCSSCAYGSYAIIEHKNGYRTVYGHLSTISVITGQKLNSGEKVGTVGNTGHSYGCHLHFEIRAYEEFVDPLNYIHP